MVKKLKFKDFLSVDYVPGEPDLVKKNAKKRKQDIPTGNTSEAVDEALSMSQRLQRSRQFKRYKSRIKLGRERQKHKLADDKRLMSRARKAARGLIAKRLTNDTPKDQLTFARRQEIEKRLDKMGPRIDKLAKRMMPKLRKADRNKKRG